MNKICVQKNLHIILFKTAKIKKKYANLKKPIIFVTLDRDRKGLGISLAGHKDRYKMAVFICGLNPNGTAYKQGELKVGDELLEVHTYTPT